MKTKTVKLIFFLILLISFYKLVAGESLPKGDKVKRNLQEIQMTKNYLSVLMEINQIQPPFTNKQLIWERINLPYLKKLQQDKNILNAALATRLLSEYQNKARNFAYRSLTGKNYQHALLFYEILKECGGMRHYDYYNLASTYSLMGNEKQAILNLREAIKKGYRNWNYIQNDKNFQSLKNHPKFNQIIKDLKKK